MTDGASPLMNSLAHAMGIASPTLISIEGHGSISIYPRQQTYTTDLDWDSLPLLTSAQIKTSACVWAVPSVGGMPVSGLQWLAAYHNASQAVAAEPTARGLVKLLHWPDLCDVPDELVAPIVRICALLWRKPTASMLMPRVLGAQVAQTDALLHVLQAFGHVEIATGFADRIESDAGASVPSAANDERTGSAAGAVIAKLWQRLLGR